MAVEPFARPRDWRLVRCCPDLRSVDAALMDRGFEILRCDRVGRPIRWVGRELGCEDRCYDAVSALDSQVVAEEHDVQLFCAVDTETPMETGFPVPDGPVLIEAASRHRNRRHAQSKCCESGAHRSEDSGPHHGEFDASSIQSAELTWVGRGPSENDAPAR